MIRLTRAVVAARPGHALALFLLGLLAIAAAVSAPAYARMAQYSVVGSDVDATPLADQGVAVTRSVILQPSPVDEGVQPSNDPDLIPRVMPDALRINGFGTVYDETLDLAAGRTADDYTLPGGTLELNSVLSYRSGACAHVQLVAGRCMDAPMEVMVSQQTADQLHGGVGATLQIQYTVAVSTRDGVIFLPVGDPATLSVVGVFRLPGLRTDPYWSGSPFVFAGPEQYTALVGADTMAALKPYIKFQTYELYPLPGALSPDRLARVQTDVTASYTRVGNANYAPNSQLPALLKQITTDQRRAAVGPTVAGVPLVVLCWFVIFLAVAQTAQARRPELALLKLRGASPVDRWWLSAAESVVPLVAGGLVGYLAGHLAVLAFSQLTLAHPGPLQFTGASVLYAGTAMLGALTVGVLALRRDLAAPVAELMRRVTRQVTRWQSAIIISVVATLAGVAVFEAHSNLSADPTGLVLLGPALVVLAIGLLLAGLLDPVAERVGAFALRRGRLGLGLAALQIGRPRSSRRVVALLTIAVGLFVFAVTANDVSVRAREQQAAAQLGAERVVTVDGTDPTKLLHAVRGIDPNGRYAMAVVELPDDGPLGAGLLLADTTRLATVAFWPGSGSAATAAHAVHPTLAPSIDLTGNEFLLDADFTPAPTVSPAEQGFTDPLDEADNVQAVFDPLAGGQPIISTAAVLQPGHHTYRLEAPCQAGCRLTGLNPALTINDQGSAALTLTGLRTVDGKTTLADASAFDKWLDASAGLLALHPGPSGLTLTAAAPSRANTLIQPPDRTQELPVIGAGTSSVQPLSTSHSGMFADDVATTTMLPRLGASGGLGDLTVAIQDGILLGRAKAEVWLNSAAPPDIVDRLSKAGLAVSGDDTRAEVVARAGQRPSALGWRFFLVLGSLALVLGIAGLLLASTVERRTRAYALRAMRTQGLAWSTALASGLIGYLSIVVCGAVFGAGAALVAWWLDGAYLPIVEGRPLGQGLPGWPGLDTLGWWIVAAAGLLLVAMVATAALARSVRLGRRVDFGGGPTS
jgi:hypothetical protein